MPEHVLASPTGWLQRFAADVDVPPAADYERWWRERGQAISDAVDRAGREASIEPVFRDLARFAGNVLARRQAR